MTTTGVENTEILFNESAASNLNKNSQKMSVKVTDYSYGNINPSPIKLPKDTELLEEFLSPRKLQALTGVDNLETVEYLEMRVNTDQMSLGNFGMYLPNLSQIKLSGSYIPRIRDLGTSLWNLQVLWMPQCCLQCLDGLVTMANIRELYLAYNDIEDISSCGMLENLEILDLEGNRIEETSNLHYLSMCTNLSRLTLEGNPVCNPSKYNHPMTYRKFVFGCVSQLEYLDDISVHQNEKLCGGDIGDGTPESNMTINASLELEDHWNFINSMLIESGLIAESDRSKDPVSPVSCDDSGRPTSSCVSSARPSTATRPTSSNRRPLTTALGRPLSSGGLRPATAASTEMPEGPDDSNLTAGHIVCGNITKSLRRHSEEQHSDSWKHKPTETRPKTSFNPPKMPDPTNCNIEESCENVLKELNLWRQQYERSKARIEHSKAPQVLTIEYSEDEIEEVDVANKVRQIDNHQSTTTEPQMPSKPPPPQKKLKAEGQLNPIRNGRLATEQSCPDNSTSWIHSLKKSMDSNTSPVTSTIQTGSRMPSAPPMSRIRRQLLQSGVSSITPSKPSLRK